MGLDYEGILSSWLNPDIYYDPSLTDPAVVTADLPARFNGSQEAARRYAEGYQWGQKNVVQPREKTAPYVAAGLAGTMAAPWLIDVAATGALNSIGKLGNYFVNNPVGQLWAKMLPRAGADLAGFEAVNRLPNAWGDKTMLEQAGDIGRWAGRNAYRLNGPTVNSQTGLPYADGWYTPEGEEIAGNVGNAVGQFVGMVPTGVAGSMLVNGVELGSNAIARAAANRMARRADYMRPISDMMQERGIESTNLSGNGRRDIQTLLESGEMNPMDLEVGPAGSRGSAPANLVRNVDGSVARTPDGYVVRHGRDFTVDPNNPREFFYDNAGRRYESIAEATGSGRRIEAPGLTAEELTNFAVDAQNQLSSEEQRALREYVQNQVNETLDRMHGAQTRRLEPGEFDWDAFERGEMNDRILANNDTGQIVSINPETGELLRALDMESTNWLMPQEETVANGEAARLLNPSRLSADEIVIPEATPEEMETLRENTRNLISRLVRQDMNRITNTRSLADLDVIDRDLRLGRIADQNTSSYLGDINRGLSAGDEDWYSLQEDYDILRDAIDSRRSVLQEDVRNNARRRLGDSMQSIQNMYEDELNQLGSLNRRELLEAIGVREEDLNAGLSTSDADYMNVNTEFNSFYDRMRDRMNALQRSAAPTRSAMPSRASLSTPEGQEAYMKKMEDEARGMTDISDVFKEYLSAVEDSMDKNVAPVHGDRKYSEEMFLREEKDAFADEDAYLRAKAKLLEILRDVPQSEKADFRMTREQFDDVYSEARPVHFKKFKEIGPQLKAKGYGRFLNEYYKDLGIDIDFTKIDDPVEYANVVQAAIRKNGLVDADTVLPLDIEGLSYRSNNDPRGSWLVEKFYREFGNPENRYAGVSMSPSLSTSTDSKQMQYLFSAKNYGEQPGQVTWSLSSSRDNTNGLDRNHVFIDSNGKPVFGDERTAKKAMKKGFDKSFTPEEIDYLKRIIAGSQFGYDSDPVYVKARELADFVAKESESRLNSPLEYIFSQDPKMRGAGFSEAERRAALSANATRGSRTGFLEQMLFPKKYDSYIVGPRGYTPIIETPAPLILMHERGGLLDRLNSHYGDKAKVLDAVRNARENQFAKGGYKKDAKAASGDKYYDIVRQRRNSAFNALLRSGMTTDEAKRLAPMIVAQQVLEGGWVLSRKDNNFGGMRASGKTLAYDSEDAFQDAYIKMLDSKWHTGRPTEYSWRSAQDMDDWARILNREDLNLTTKDAWEKYNKGRQGNDFVYLYAPQWENGTKSYRDKLRGVENWTNAYLDMVGMDEPYENLVPQTDLRQRYLDNQPEFVQQMAPEKKVSPPLFNALIPTSVQKLMNSREDGGLLLKDYRSGGSIHIKPSKRGTFTAAAKKHGKSVQAFASQVLAHKDNYSPAMVKKANFARNSKKWHHGDGGLIDRYGVDKVREALLKMKG